ncbi:WAP, Kazal, immunoglobulin, Kunitz and NTR domain-containing protein 2 [Oryzias melastigma]|nr:WAP, Kazal, immunoglobulin, Kunitz and NTR domain-containing protein 2 [Oryzias melastigma]
MLLWLCFLASACTELRAAGLPPVTHTHAGICPNEVNPNLWVDAMSTCTRECQSDQECESSEKCCQNVCGGRSCVVARSAGGGASMTPKEASCAGFACTQQGSECDVWDGQPHCKCRERCGREPSFTCASDGMTYYNRCYMDAEACSKGVALTVVSCRFHLSWPKAGHPLPHVTTAGPTTTPPPPPTELQPPLVVSTPAQQVVRAGDTASFLCAVTGRPQPDIIWERRVPDGPRGVALRRNHVVGNMVVTNAGQLVIYNAQPADSGAFMCTAQNPSGSVQTLHLLTVLPAEAPSPPPPTNQSRCPPEECPRPPGGQEDCGGVPERVGWFYEPNANACRSFPVCGGQEPPRGFESFQDCMRCCGPELAGPCGLPSQRGPCKAYEPRWAYSSALRGCHTFIYGGCGGNDNNFQSKQACEDSCPVPRGPRCAACRPRAKMLPSFCRSDFVITGRLTDVSQDKDAGHALVTIDKIFKDEKMGLRFFGAGPLEVTFLNVDWICSCPNITGAASEGLLLIMGHVSDGMAVLQPDSFMGAASPRRLRRLQDAASKNACEVLRAITSSPP